MSENTRARKNEIRAHAEQHGVNYTTAMRALDTRDSVSETRTTPYGDGDRIEFALYIHNWAKGESALLGKVLFRTYEEARSAFMSQLEDRTLGLELVAVRIPGTLDNTEAQAFIDRNNYDGLYLFGRHDRHSGAGIRYDDRNAYLLELIEIGRTGEKLLRMFSFAHRMMHAPSGPRKRTARSYETPEEFIAASDPSENPDELRAQWEKQRADYEEQLKAIAERRAAKPARVQRPANFIETLKKEHTRSTTGTEALR